MRQSSRQNSIAALALGFLALIAATSPARAAADADLRVARFGEKGPVVLFIPGLASSGDLWTPWAERLGETHRVVVVTPPGFAGTPPAGWEEGFYERYLPALATLLEGADAKDALIIGHSIGGFTGLRLAKSEPERVGRVLVVDSLPFLAELFLPGATPETAPARAEAMAAGIRAMSDEAYAAQQARTATILTNTPDFAPTIAQWSTASDRATIAAAMAETLAADFRAELGDITQEVLVLVAWDPAMGLPKTRIETLFKNQYEALPNGEVRVVDGARHFLMIDAAEAFDAALREMTR